MTEACAWCGGSFAPRTSGGKPQTFCRPSCRRAFDAAARCWVAQAVADGRLTVDALRNGAVATRALLQGAVSPAPVAEARRSGPEIVGLVLDQMTAAQVRQLTGGGPSRPAAPDDLAKAVESLFRYGLFMAALRR
jgi:hypothetical protein